MTGGGTTDGAGSAGRAGRRQGAPRGRTEQANALASFVLEVTDGVTLRELAERYHVGKTMWGEYRSGQKLVPLDLLERLVADRTPDEATRVSRTRTARRLHAAAVGAAAVVTVADAAAGAPGPAPEPGAPGTVPSPPTDRAPRRRRHRLAVGATVTAAVAVVALLLLVALLPSGDENISAGGKPPSGGASRDGSPPVPAAPLTGTGVFAIGPDGDGVLQWDGPGAGDWTRIGDTAKRLWAGPAGLFATGVRGDGLFAYGGSPGRWHQVGEAGADFAISGTRVYRLAPDRGSVHVWDGRGTSWTWVGGPASRLYGGGPGLFATNPKDGRIFKYAGRPGEWEFVGTAGADFALTDRHLYGLTPDRAMVTRWLAPETPDADERWTWAAGPAGALFAGAAGLFSTDPTGTRLRHYAKNAWHDIGPAGAEVRVAGREVFVLTDDRTSVRRWDPRTGTWTRVGGPAGTLAVTVPRAGP
ncbi:hypothetical protein ACFV85_18535 [Streptomyces niveus]|uniref:hypothetical protein n=1 Tax=Streptomyces niveus TaxID=193462 RepID=UPI00364D901F